MNIVIGAGVLCTGAAGACELVRVYLRRALARPVTRTDLGTTV